MRYLAVEGWNKYLVTEDDDKELRGRINCAFDRNVSCSLYCAACEVKGTNNAICCNIFPNPDQNEIGWLKED